MSGYNSVPFEEMVGKTFTRVEQTDSDRILFVVSDDEQYEMIYNPDCCASCSVEDICGDLQDLVGSPIVRAEENSNDDLPPLPESEYSYTWTFYRIGTMKGTVVIRWYGSSNGYYSETPSFERV